MYKGRYCKDLTEHCSEGHSILSFVYYLYDEHKISISYKTLMEWADSYDDFRLALEIAQSAELFYWESKAAQAMTNGDSQALQLSKFMLDQKYGLYESIYKKTLNKKTMSDLVRGRATVSDGNPETDIIEGL